MSIEELFKAAEQLSAPKVTSGIVLKEQAEIMASLLTARLLKRDDLEGLIGPGNEGVMENNHLNHFKYISTLAALYDPKSFVETVLWVVRTYIGRGFTPKYWKVMLPEAKSVILEHLAKEDSVQVQTIYSWLEDHIDDFLQVSRDASSFYERIGPLTRTGDND